MKGGRTIVDFDKAPIVFSDEAPIKLKIPPKACELCGKPFIPTGGNAKFCPRCRELSQAKRERSLFSKHATMAFGHGPWSKDYEEITETKPSAEYVASLAQAARFVFDIDKTYGFGVTVVRPSYTQVEEYGNYKMVPYVQLGARQFFEVFGDTEYEYSHALKPHSVRKWVGGVLFEAIISTYGNVYANGKVDDLWTE